MSPSDAELARQALAGSQTAYRLLVTRYATAAVNLAARLVNDRSVAEDLAQEAFVRAFARLRAYDPQRRFSSWFFQVVRNVTVDYLRRKRVHTVSLDELRASGYAGPVSSEATSPAAEAERHAVVFALERALGQIRGEYRDAIVLHYQQGLPLDEIAAILGVPVGTVKTYLHRGRKTLADILTAAGWGPEPTQ